jgi:hypothetical protein
MRCRLPSWDAPVQCDLIIKRCSLCWLSLKVRLLETWQICRQWTRLSEKLEIFFTSTLPTSFPGHSPLTCLVRLSNGIDKMRLWRAEITTQRARIWWIWWRPPGGVARFPGITEGYKVHFTHRASRRGFSNLLWNWSVSFSQNALQLSLSIWYHSQCYSSKINKQSYQSTFLFFLSCLCQKSPST